MRPAYQRVLDLAHTQRANTIEALMGKSDLQLDLEALFGGPPAPTARTDRDRPAPQLPDAPRL